MGDVDHKSNFFPGFFGNRDFEFHVTQSHTYLSLFTSAPLQLLLLLAIELSNNWISPVAFLNSLNSSSNQLTSYPFLTWVQHLQPLQPTAAWVVKPPTHWMERKVPGEGLMPTRGKHICKTNS